MTAKTPQVLNIDDFSQIFDLPSSFIKEALPDPTTWPDLRYRPLNKEELDQISMTIGCKLAQDDAQYPPTIDLPKWQRAWEEILNKVYENGLSHNLLKPKYFNNETLRFRGDYIRVCDPSFQYNVYIFFRRIIFQKYLKNTMRAIEFGCGTGTSILILLELFPSLSIVGCDWAGASQQLLKLIAKKTNCDVKEVRFNMLTLNGKEEVNIGPDCAVITMHALEQLGNKYGPMLDYLLESRPKFCLHLEPFVELYDGNCLFDQLAVEYHKKRGYLSGFLKDLRRLQDQNIVEIIEERRLYFGSLFHEAYSLVVWRVK